MEDILFGESGLPDNISLDGFQFQSNDFFNSNQNINNDLFIDMPSSSPLSSPFLENSMDSTGYSVDYLNNMAFNPNIQMEIGTLEDALSSENSSAPGSGNQSPIREEYDLTSDDVVQVEEEDEKPKKRGRKRQKRDLASENMDVSQVTVSRDQLLKITSEEYDKILKAVTDKRELTWAESKHIKTQRRLIKNRESAQASRQRKKEHVDDLAKQCDVLRQENEALKKENSSLKEEIFKLSSIIKKTGVVMNTTANTAKAAVKGAKGGVILLVALFSFGLLFGIAGNNRAPISGTGVGSAVQLHQANSRSLLAIETTTNDSKENKMITTPVIQTPKIHRPLTTVDPDNRAQHQQKLAAAIPEKKESSGRVNIPISDSAPRDKFIQDTFHHTNDGSGTGFTTARMEEFSNESNTDTANVSQNIVIDNESLNQIFDENIIKHRRNTAYFTCTDFQQLTPVQNEPFDPNSPFYISIIVPSSSMPNSNFASSAGDKAGIVEINCQVTDVIMSPAPQISSSVSSVAVVG